MSRRLTITASLTAALLAFSLAGCSASGGSGSSPDANGSSASSTSDGSAESADSTNGTTVAPEAPAEPEVAGFNTPVTAGSFEFTVSSLEEIGTTIGQEPLSTTAQGTYLKIELSVKNVGDKAETFFDNYVTLVDVDGKQYDADSMASIYLESSGSWVSGINPGNTMSGPVIFDVPAGTVAEHLMVKDNMFSSDGELIALK